MKKILYIFTILAITLSGLTYAAEQKFPDIIDATVTVSQSTYRFNVTVSSPYDSRSRYADAYRIKNGSGTVYGVRVLTHDHANEQPFTRSVSGINIPAGVTQVIIEGRDKTYGWGGDTFTLTLPSNN
jgi:hypothetical protein